MLYLPLLFAAFGLAQEEFKALNARANSSEPYDSLLLPRGLTGRQQYCDAGYGLCEHMLLWSELPIRRMLRDSRPNGYGCCGANGDIYPLDAECCSDGNHCPKGSRCVTCRNSPGICCRGTSGDDVEPTIQSSIADVTYPPDSQTTSPVDSGSETTSYSTSYDVSYTSYTYTYHSYFYTTYTYFYITYIPLYTPTTSRTVTTTTTLSAFATDSAEAISSWSADVSSIQSDISFSQSLYSPESLAPTSTLSTVSGVAAGGGSASGSSSGAPSAHTNLVAAIFGLMSLVVGVLALML